MNLSQDVINFEEEQLYCSYCFCNINEIDNYKVDGDYVYHIECYNIVTDYVEGELL